MNKTTPIIIYAMHISMAVKEAKKPLADSVASNLHKIDGLRLPFVVNGDDDDDDENSFRFPYSICRSELCSLL